MYNQAQNTYGASSGANDVTACRDQRPHERAVQKAHEQLHRLEGLISDAEVALSPIVVPAPPTADGKDVRCGGSLTSDVIIAVDGLADRIEVLTSRLASLIGRVQV